MNVHNFAKTSLIRRALQVQSRRKLHVRGGGARSKTFHFLPLEGFGLVKNAPSISFHFGGRDPFRGLPGMEWNGRGWDGWKTQAVSQPSIFHSGWKGAKNTALDESASFCTIGGRA